MLNLDVLDLVVKLYDPKVGADPKAWDYLLPIDGSYSALAHADGIQTVVFRGSDTEKDWLEDFDRCALPEIDPELGGVHPGFISGVRAAQTYLDQLVEPGAIIAGHSLGAGHAVIYGAHLCKIGKPPSRIVVFGLPRPGFQQLADIVKDVPLYSYLNCGRAGHDLVTDVPLTLEPLCPYVQPRQFIPVNAPPPPDDPWLMFAWHHSQLYQRGLAQSLSS